MNNKYRFISILVLATVIFNGLLVVFAPIYANAAVAGTVIDRSTIMVGERAFFDSDIDDEFNYREVDATDGCPDEILGFNNDNFRGTNTPSSATIRIGAPVEGSSNCNKNDDTINFSSRGNFSKAFVWDSENVIKGSDGKLTFERKGTSQTFTSTKAYKDDTNSVSCFDTITVSADNKTLSLSERKGLQSDDHDYDWYPFNPGNRNLNDTSKCWEAPRINGIQISGTPEDGNDGASAGGSSSGSTVASQPSCESEGGVLSWILCSLLGLMDNVMAKMDETINSMLKVPDPYIQNGGLESAWRRIRNIAYIVLIPIMLVMVISTALGFEFISAYTVKKAIPRLIAATLFIALSYALCSFLIVLTNNVGNGIMGLITNSVPGARDITLSSLFNPSGENVAIGVSLGIVTGGVILAIGSIGILFSYALIAFVGLLVGFITLAFRQFLLVALVLLAPLAILAWIFPGNDKLWKLWWGSFSKLLLLYPLIMVLIASGRSFAAIVQQTSAAPGDVVFVGTVATFIKIVAYVGPYFFIPAAFKFAGGIFATVSGMANDRSKGLFDRQKKYRGRKAQENWRDTKAGDKAWRPRAFNNLGERAGVGLSGRFGIGARGQASVQKQRRNNAAERMAKDEELKQLALSSDDGNAVMALSGGTNEGARAAAEDLRESWIAGGLSRPEATVRAQSALNDALAVGVNRSRSQAAFSTMMQNKARAISGGEEGRQVFERGLNRLHGESAPNDAAQDETRQAARFFARESGRADLGGDSVENGFTRTGAYKAIRGYEPAVASQMTDLTARHNDARTRGDQAAMFETSAQITAVRNAMGQDMSEGNKQAVTAMLVGTGIDISSARSVDQQLGTQINPANPDGATEMIRDRVGLYDSGELTQAQLVARQNQINNPS